MAESEQDRLRRAEDENKDLIRQSERTVDNLKRILAFIFAISFGLAASRMFVRLEPFLTGTASPTPPILNLLTHLEMAVAFAITAALFFHQGAKFLDIRYATDPIPDASPGGFLLDFGTQLITMVPFYFMAFSMGKEVVDKVGYHWFFMSYVLLINVGLLLLLVHYYRPPRKDEIGAKEKSREVSLRTYWFAMNSLFLLVLLAVFTAFNQWGNACPAGLHADVLPLFLITFGFLVLVRDWLDYSRSWPYLYPTRQSRVEALKKWPMRYIERSEKKRLWVISGLIFWGGATYLTLYNQLFDPAHWIKACMTPLGP